MKSTLDIAQIERLLLDVLKEVPSLSKTAPTTKQSSEIGQHGPDLIIDVRTPRPRTLIVEWKSKGSPKNVREAAFQLTEWLKRGGFGPKTYAVVASPHFSPESARIIRDAGIGYVDLDGNCFLNFDNVFIERERPHTASKSSENLRSIYGRKSSRILRVLLMSPLRNWKVDELAETAGVSLGLVSYVKRILIDEDWISTTPQRGFALEKPEPLLHAWSREYTYHDNAELDYYSMDTMAVTEKRISDCCREHSIRFALTLFSGASRLAPFTRYQQVFAYIDTGIEAIIRDLQLKAVESGPNVVLLRPYDDGVFYGQREFDTIPVVSPIQLYLDLAGHKGRGSEAAEHLLDHVIQPLWSQNQNTGR